MGVASARRPSNRRGARRHAARDDVRRPALPSCVDRFLLSDRLWRIFPTPTTCYLNQRRLRAAASPPQMPAAEWSQRERRSLLVASDERMRNLEAKGPALATITAVVVAAALFAIT